MIKKLFNKYNIKRNKKKFYLIFFAIFDTVFKNLTFVYGKI